MSLAAAGHEEQWLQVAHLLRPQGRRGELLAEPFTDIDGIFEAGRTFHLSPGEHATSSGASVTLESCWRPTGRNAGRIVLKFSGIDTISHAEAAQGKHLFLPQKEVPALEEGTYLVQDLIGCTLVAQEHPVGVITELQFPVAPDGRTRLAEAMDLLVVEPTQATAGADTDPILIPFVKAWLVSVDLPAKRIVMDLPQGLLETTDTP